MSVPGTALSEWKRYWPLPFAAALGYATAVIHLYSMGPFIAPLQEEFGWSRAQISGGVTIAAFISSVLSIPMGLLIDRVGPRRLALVWILLISAAYAALGAATGTTLNWIVHWVVLALGTLGVQGTVWASAVACRFDRSRGLALAITLSGGSIAAALFPVMAVWLIEHLGWRRAFAAQAGLWLLLVYPILFLFFRSTKDEVARLPASAAVVLPGVSFAAGMRSPSLYKLMLAGGICSFTAIGALVHFVPILTDGGTAQMRAAGIASLIGLSSLVGRIGTGTLLDRFPAHRVGALICLLPIIGSSLLLLDGGNPYSQSLAAVTIGLALGAEVDVIAYLASKHFGMKNFGALFGALTMALGLGAAFGPLAAGAMFDAFGNYREFLMMTAGLMAVACVAILSVGPVPKLDGLEA